MINEQHTKEYVERSGGAIIWGTGYYLYHSHFKEGNS